MAKTINVTRKIQLLIDSEDKEFVYDSIGTLMRWQSISIKCANLIYTHQFLQEQMADMIYLAEGTKVKLADHHKYNDGILVSSRTNSTYKVLTNKFKGEIPSNIFNNLNSQLVAAFLKEKPGFLTGERSLKNFKRGMAMPFSANCIRNLKEDIENRCFKFTLFGIPFKTYLGHGFDEKRDLLRLKTFGMLEMTTSHLKIDQKKIFLLASFLQELQPCILNDEVIAEASLSLGAPLIVRIGKESKSIGTKDEFLYRRLAIQAARSRIQSSVNSNRTGHGRKRKRKPLEHYLNLEKNYVLHKMHLYSRQLIDFCLRHRAATLILLNQEQKEETAKADPFLLRNWSYAGLKDLIAFKASKAGINMIIE